MIRARFVALTCSLLLAAPLAFSQNPGGPPPDMPGHADRPDRRGGPDERGGGGGDFRRRPDHGMGLPPGAWWRSPQAIKQLALTAEQQKRMDDIMLESRLQLIQRHASLEEEQVKLEPLMNANPLDQKAALAQIGKIADLRADLEKANAKTLLGLRGVLTADQWTKLQAERHNHHEDHQPHGPAGSGPGEE